jgi:hypothetical protein
MKRLMKILLGLSIGAAVALLLAPKSGRELREQLIGGATGKLLPAAPVEFPEPEGERLWDAGTATAVAEPPVVEPAFEEPAIAQETASEDLRARIEETRAAVETDIAQPFASVATEEAVVEEAAAEEAIVEEAVVEEAAVDEVVIEEPVEEPAAETPVPEEPVAEQVPVREAAAGLVADITSGAVAAVAVEEAQVEEPAAEEPVAEEEPSAREGGAIDQAEMRRRIEETRARLKAKAFDAMMSGEAALLSRDSGEKPVPKGDGVKLDDELESTIDESLSQEEY